MSISNLAEAVILQSLEDLWNPVHRKESLEFFEGSGFKMCAQIAGIDSMKQNQILHLLGGNENAETSKLLKA